MKRRKFLEIGSKGLVLIATGCTVKPQPPVNLYSSSIEEIMAEAKESQTFIFGEFHGEEKNGVFHSFNEDDMQFRILLPKLKTAGYNDLGIELHYKFKDVIDKYMRNEIISTEVKNALNKEYNGVNDYLSIISDAKQLGMRVHCFDKNPGIRGTKRNKLMFEGLKERIFNENSNAKVAIFCGGYHANEKPTRHAGIDRAPYEKPLGYFLNEFTGGKNTSVSFVYNGEFTDQQVIDYILPNQDFYIKQSGEVMKKR